MSKQEILVFRKQMEKARTYINNIEQAMNSVEALHKIDIQHYTIDTSKQFFKDIVAEPKRLLHAEQFLNDLLPPLAVLTATYKDISQRIDMDGQVSLILDKTAITIDKICLLISKQYMQFHGLVSDELNNEIERVNDGLNEVLLERN